ncbi:MAG: hypothetical protein OXR07_03070 [Nitrospira sp.]|nr:hypothetical protein [Nitrospira sp.]MDD9859466.1 hypothetical protein [Nitrospira sp.]
MDTKFSGDESVSADELRAAIEDIQDQQNQRFKQRSPWRAMGLFAVPVDLSSEEDPSGLGGAITAPASFVGPLPDVNGLETDVQELRKDWTAVGNDFRIAILRHSLQTSGG